MEERKFLRTLPEYAAYKARTGFLWPRLRRS
jgi:protein-S-isoprenylcysteine O-methyltransferase Ste14